MALKTQKVKSKAKLVATIQQAYLETMPDQAGPDAILKSMNFANDLSSEIVDAIEDMIQAQMITIINTPTTLIAPPTGGPVTGVINIVPTNVKIN